MKIIYNDLISVKDYNHLRASAGWAQIDDEQAAIGLKRSSFIIVAHIDEKTVGMARLIWDGGCAALVKDVIVLPEYQAIGIGREMMTKLLDYLKNNIKPGWRITVDLMAAEGKEGFYSQFGFQSRPCTHRGSGMELLIQ